MLNTIRAHSELGKLKTKLKEFFDSQCPEIGMGEDPLGFILASHVMLNHERKTLKKQLDVAVGALEKACNDLTTFDVSQRSVIDNMKATITHLKETP